VLRIRHLGRLVSEFVALAIVNRTYWPLTLVAFLLLTSALVAASQGAAPLIYALF
jgi:hypothetical protein